MDIDKLKQVLEAALAAADEPLSLNQMEALFHEDAQPGHGKLTEALHRLAEDCKNRGVEVKQVASGFRLQIKNEFQPWIARLWQERPPRYSRALLETLALIAYRQPVTRGEIEEVRGVAVSSNIVRTLLEREWIRVVGHRDVPGRPALFGTTKKFLDYFNLKSLDELPTLAEIRDIDDLEPELELENQPIAAMAKEHTNHEQASDEEADEATTEEVAEAQSSEEEDQPETSDEREH